MTSVRPLFYALLCPILFPFLFLLTLFSSFLPAQTTEQGNVIGLVSVYIVYVRSCHQIFFVIERTRDLIYLKFVATDFLLKIIGRAKRAPHWGVQSRFRVIYVCLFYTSYSYNSISRYAYRGISAHIPRRDLVIFCVLRSH